MLLSLSGCADTLILLPSTQPLDAHGAERRTFVHDGKTIEFYVARSPGVANGAQPQAYLLDFGGNAGRAEKFAYRRAERWGSRAVEVWAMNYPGYGQSDGPAALQAIAPAALAAYDHLAGIAGNRPIFVGGYSLGTAAALYVADHRPVAGLVLQSPPPIRRLVLDHYGWWNLWLVAWPVSLQIPDELDSLANAPHATAPAIFVLSGNDSLVPIEYQRMIVNSYGGEKLILLMPNATHDSILAPDEEARLRGDLDWLWKRAVKKGNAVEPPRR